MCGRGYLDKQKSFIDRHSSTASRLSHRLACSLMVQHDLDVEAWDISTAFLQGLKFSDIAKKARHLGHEVREIRKVWITPPANVWRHLRHIPDSRIRVADVDTGLFALELLKAMYGLVDGPLLFQLALLEFLTTELGMTRSIHDDNYLFYTSGFSIECLIVVHVDDLLIIASNSFTTWARTQIEKRFGKVKRHLPPFVYLGIHKKM